MMSEAEKTSPAGVSVAIMCYNEAASLEACCHEIHDELQLIQRPFDITIIDDGSTDGSSDIADQLARELPFTRVIHFSKNRGLGEVYRTGFYAGEQEAITLFPADNQFSGTIISQFLGRLSDADMVLGYIPSIKKGRPLFLIALSWVERLLYRLGFGHFPDFQGIMMFRRSILDGIELTSRGRGWAIQMELILRVIRAGHCVVQEATDIRPRTSGQSKATSFRNAWSNFVQLVALKKSM